MKCPLLTVLTDVAEPANLASYVGFFFAGRVVRLPRAKGRLIVAATVAVCCAAAAFPTPAPAVDVPNSAVSGLPTVSGGSVRALALAGSTLYIGGDFTSVGGVTRNGLAAVDLVTRSVTSFDPNPNPNRFVGALSVSGTTLYVGGEFTTIGGQTRNHVAAFDTATGALKSFDANVNGPVYALAPSGSALYVGGSFTTIQGQARQNVGAVDASTGNLISSFSANANNLVLALAVTGSTLYVGGGFSTIGGTTRNRLAGVDAATGSVASFDPSVRIVCYVEPGGCPDSSAVHALLAAGSTLYVAGHFNSPSSSRIAAFDTGAHTWKDSFSYVHDIDDTAAAVDSLVLSGSTLYAGAGAFVTGIDATTAAGRGFYQDYAEPVVAMSSSTLFIGSGNTSPGTPPKIAAYAAADHLSVETQPASATAGSAFGVQPVVEISDDFGHSITQGPDATASVTASIQSGCGTLQGTTTVGASGGVASFTDLRIDCAGPHVLQFTKSDTSGSYAGTGQMTVATASFDVAPGPATGLAYTSSTTSLTSGSSRTLTVEVRDAYDNRVTSSAASVHFARNSGPGTVSDLPADVTAVAGVASKTVSGALAGSITITASSTGLPSAATTFDVVPGAPKKLVYTSTTASVASGSSKTITAKVTDAAGNTITSPNFSVTFAKSSGAGTVSGLPATVTSSSGLASRTVTGVLAGSITVTASATDLTAAATTFPIVPGPPKKLVYTSTTASVASGAVKTLTVKVADAAGNRVPSPNYAVTFAKSAGAGTVSGLPATVTSSSGLASRTVTGVLAGSITVTASASGLTSAASAFTVIPGKPTKLLYTSATTSVASGAAKTLTVKVADAAGNRVPSPNYAVTFAKSAGAGTVSGLPATVTSSSGLASRTVTGVLAGSVTVKASATGLTSAATTFTIVPGPPKKLVYTSATTSVASGGAKTLTVKVADAAGNRVPSPNYSVTFSKSAGAGTVTGLPATVTSSSGLASRTVTGVLAGSVTVTASATGLTSAGTAFTVVPGKPTKLVFVSSTASLSRGTSRTLIAKVTDAAGNKVTSPNYSVTFAKISGSGTVSGLPATVASSSGLASKAVTGTGAGSITIRASASGLTAAATTFSVT
jgi:hypothetical protein